MFRSLPVKYLKFIIYILSTIVAIYYLPKVISTLWLILLLVLYFRSKDEPFWLAFFMVLSDGFLGFFGLGSAMLSFIPGQPAIELVQFYFLISLIKILKRKQAYPLFYKDILFLTGLYILFLIPYGFSIGLTGGLNLYFRVFRLVLPLALFYTIPRILRIEEDFRRFFTFIFPIVILALFSQLFDIIIGQTLVSFLGAKELKEVIVTDEIPYRGFYNVQIVLFGLFGALYYLAKKSNTFSNWYLNTVIISALAIALLSATRGWMIGFGLIILLFMIIVIRVKPGKIITIVFFIIIGFYFGYRTPIVRSQIKNATERLLTVKGIIEGDEEALETQIRTSRRSLRVIGKWKENWFTGWGFSSSYFDFLDGHVGNQNILLHSGVVGALLLLLFFLKFNVRITYQGLVSKGLFRENLVFVVFFLGWFVIHSTSGQHFALMALSPNRIITQAVFFSFGAFSYFNSKIGCKKLFTREKRP